jgi:hypothetical protein
MYCRGSTAAVAGPGLTVRGPVQSRVDLLAEVPGVLNVRIAELERLNRIDPLEVFTAFDGQVVETGDLVASVKIAPHVVDAATVDAGARLAGFGSNPIVWVAPFLLGAWESSSRESVRAPARTRFEASVRAKIEGLGSEVVAIDSRGRRRRSGRSRDGGFRPAARPGRPDPDRRCREHRPARPDASSPSPHSADGSSGAESRAPRIHAVAGAHRWTAILGLRRAALFQGDRGRLLLPRLLSGEDPSEKTVAKLGHGGILTRSQRFRFPAYARELEAPEG